jgi:hypothetical protein
MLLNNGPTNVQPQAQFDPAATLDLDPLYTVEAFPDVLLLPWRQPWSLIAHPELRLLVIHLEPNGDRTIGWRIFQGIGETSSSRPGRDAGCQP